MSPVVTICTASLTFNNCTFCPHRLYLCVLCGSENKQRFFSLSSINWLVFITETESVYCSVRAECLWYIYIYTHTHTTLYIQYRLNLCKLPLTSYEVRRTLKLAKCHIFIIHMPWSAGYLTVQQPSDQNQIVRYLTFTQQHCWRYQPQPSTMWRRVAGR